MRPVGADHTQPVVDLAAEEAVLGVNLAAELFFQATRRKKRYTNHCGLENPTPPCDPDIKIENSRRVGESDHNLPLHGDAVLIDFGVKRLTEGDRVGAIPCANRSRIGAFREPEMKVIKKVKAGPVRQVGTIGLFLRAEKDGRGEDPLKTLHHSSVVATIFSESEEIQNLCGAIEMDGTALLPEGEGCDPDGNETVLAEG